MNEDQREKMEEYLDKEMSGKDRQQFEDELAKNVPMQRALQLEEDLRAGISRLGHTALRDRLRRIHAEEIGEEDGATIVPMRSRGLARRWAAIAAMLIAAVGLMYWATQMGATDPAGLYASNYEPYSLELTQRGAGEQSEVQAAEQAYRDGDYATAGSLLEELYQADQQDAEIALGLAVARWENGDSSGALELLQQLVDHPLLSDKAQWYRAMIFLKEENLTAARDALQAVAGDENSTQAVQAQEVLSRLTD